MEKFARKYINRGTDDNPIWQLLPDECEELEQEPEPEPPMEDCPVQDIHSS